MVQKQKVLLVGLFEYKLKNIGGGEVTKPRNIKNYLEKKAFWIFPILLL
jgi:hypothetical protein